MYRFWRFLYLIGIVSVCLGIVGCNTNNPNPQINKRPFSDYIPWWSTNR